MRVSAEEHRAALDRAAEAEERASIAELESRRRARALDVAQLSRNSVLDEVVRLRAEMERLRAERDAIAIEHAQCGDAAGHLDVAVRERDALRAEAERLRADLGELQERHAWADERRLRAEKEAIRVTAERDEATARCAEARHSLRWLVGALYLDDRPRIEAITRAQEVIRGWDARPEPAPEGRPIAGGDCADCESAEGACEVCRHRRAASERCVATASEGERCERIADHEGDHVHARLSWRRAPREPEADGDVTAYPALPHWSGEHVVLDEADDHGRPA